MKYFLGFFFVIYKKYTMKIERNRQLAKDIVTYVIGNTGSKFLAFLLIPILTFFLGREELGYYDISLEAILFLLPVITLQMRESTFRLLINTNDESYRKHILSSTFFIEFIIFAIVLVIASFLPFFFSIRYFRLIVLSVYAYSLYEIYIQAVRSVYSSAHFVYISLIASFLTLALTLLFYLFFKRGIEALFIANIISRISAMLIIEIPRRKVLYNISLRYFTRKYVREIFHYSMPMLGTAVAFAIITSPGKFVVNYFLGTDANGILAPAHKFMSILIMLGTSFSQAWQVTAVKNYREHDNVKFFSEVFNKYTIALCLLVLCISFGLRSFKTILIGSEFYQSVNLIYIYCVSAVFYCLALFLEIIYQCTKQTAKILYSIVTCAVISFPLTILLTKSFGLTGTITALTVAYVYLFIFRYFQTKSTLPIRLNRDFWLSFIVLAVGGVIFYCTNNRIVDYTVLFMVSGLLIYYLLTMKKYVSKN